MTATTRWIGLVVFIAICFAAAGIGSLPYLAWVTFAAVLNAAIWRLNA